MIRKVKMRRFTIYFRDGSAQPFVLEPTDTIKYHKVDEVAVIDMRIAVGDEVSEVRVERDSVAFARTLPFTVEVDDEPKPKPERIEEPEGISFRG